MDNKVSEQILQYVAQSRERAEKAERDFDVKNLRIQRKADRTIDLFGGSATSQVVDIASDARRACDDLYSAYQMEIQLLDEACRPLLDSQPQPSLEAVKSVCALIKWLNDESEIENNFSASLNSHGLGQVASAKYVPTMANKMIQRYWEAKYDSWPGRAEELAAEKEKRRQAAEQAKLRKAEEQARREEVARQKAAAEERERNEIAQRIDKKVAELNVRIQNAEQTISSSEKQTNETIAQEQERIAAMQAERDRLGFFKIKEKKALDQEIAELRQQIEQIKENHDQIQAENQEEIEETNEKLKLLTAVSKSECSFGSRYYSNDGQPMKWIVASNNGREMVLLSKQTVGLNAYYSGSKWLNSEFIEKVFTQKEQLVLKPIERGEKHQKVVYPTQGDVQSCCNTLGTSPEDVLIAHIRSDHIMWGKKCGYTSQQITNGINSDINSATAYWLETRDDGRSGWANYVGQSNGKWVSARIGSGAPFGIRPMICLDLNKLLDII